MSYTYQSSDTEQTCSISCMVADIRVSDYNFNHKEWGCGCILACTKSVMILTRKKPTYHE